MKKSNLKYMTYIQRKLRSVDTEVREHLLVVLVRSLLIYHGTPLTAAGLWKKKEVDKLEVFLYRESAKLTNQIRNAAILNVMQSTRPCWEVVC